MEEIIHSSILATVPLLLAALGGIVAERSGVLNVGLEGLMLAAALATAWAGSASTDFLGFLAALAVALACGLALGWVMVAWRADQVVVGIAFNILVLGVTSYLFAVLSRGSFEAMSTSGHTAFPIPGLSDVPWLGQFFQVHWITYTAYVLVPFVFFVLFRTGLGLRLRACGEYAEGARASGIDVVRTRVLAMGASGVLAGAAGAFLVVGDVGIFHQNMTAGRGYIALAVVIIGRWTPFGALAAATLFGVAEALSFYLQVHGVGIPTEVVLATPYIVGLAAVTIFGRTVRPPAEEGRPLYLPT